jgi:hypothetical protein
MLKRVMLSKKIVLVERETDIGVSSNVSNNGSIEGNDSHCLMALESG